MYNTNLTLNPANVPLDKIDISLITSAGVKHNPREFTAEAPRSNPYIEVVQQYDACAIDIQAVYSTVPGGTYLSIVPYTLGEGCSLMWRVCNYKATCAEIRKKGESLLRPRTGYTDYRSSDLETEWGALDKGCNNGVQVRIYPDLKMSVVRRVKLDNQYVFYISEVADGYRGQLWPANGTVEERIARAASHLTIVSTDQEIYEHRERVTQAHISALHGILPRHSHDLRNNYFKYMNGNSTAVMTEATMAVLRAFFEIDAAKNAARAINFGKKTGNSIRANCCWCLFDIFAWCAVAGAASKAAVKKADVIREIIATEPFKSFWEHPGMFKRDIAWGRCGDKVVAMTHYVSNWNTTSRIFVYDTRTKTRMMGECYQNVWSFPVPSLRYICTHFHPYLENEAMTANTFLLEGITLEELFKGSNVAWILTYAADTIVPDYSCNRWANVNLDHVVPVKEAISEKHLGLTALVILTTTGTRMLELLLKARLFNMYFYALELLTQCNLSSTFKDLDDKNATQKRVWYGYEGAEYANNGTFCNYHSKATSLPVMFGETLKVLRDVDAHCAPKPQELYDGRITYHRVVPPLADLQTAKMDLTHCSPEQRNAILAWGCDLRGVYGGYRGHGAIAGGLKAIRLIEPDATTPQIVTYIQKYGDALSRFYQDYLNIRKRLKELQQACPQIRGIFDERQYPELPEKAKRFIRFLPGMRGIERSWNRLADGNAFIAEMERAYPKAADEGRIETVMDTIHGSDRVVGIVIRMTPGENLRWLHDEGSQVLTLHKNAAKDAQFKQAVKRVQPLEWSDPKSGLCIVAPKDVADLSNEGHILHHCVGSYAQAIIDGTENIMFLRRIDRPYDPYFTVEVLPNGDIRQVHCYCNGALTENDQRQAYTSSHYAVYDSVFDIIGFLRKWARKFPTRVREASIKERYGALCALHH